MSRIEVNFESEEQQDKSVEYIFGFIKGADDSIDETLTSSDAEPSSEPIASNTEEIITFPDATNYKLQMKNKERLY